MKPLISLNNVGKFLGGREILRGISLDVHQGDIIGIIGPSGAGKSTLLRIVNQLARHDTGDVVIDGLSVTRNLPDRKLSDLRSRVGMVFQGFHLWPHMTALQNVIEAPVQTKRLARDKAIEEGMEFLDQVGLKDRAHHYPSQLSGGQQQRVAIARALAMRPVSILFDEPTSALDPRLAKEVLATMTGLAAKKVTMMVVTHEMSFARRVANRVIYMRAGEIVQDRPTQDFFDDQHDPEIREFLLHD